MAGQTAVVLAAVLAYGVPASAGSLCGRSASGVAQTDQRGQRPGEPEAAKDKDKDKDKDARPHEEHRPFKFWEGTTQTELGITSQQSTEIETIFQATRPKLEATKQKLDKLEAGLSQTIKDNSADLATLSQQIDRLEIVRAELYKTRTLMLYRMRSVLSGDQRAKLQALMDRWEASRRKSTDPTGRF
jgi:Spy/CpxP family protein refolding chaperone